MLQTLLFLSYGIKITSNYVFVVKRLRLCHVYVMFYRLHFIIVTKYTGVILILIHGGITLPDVITY